MLAVAPFDGIRFGDERELLTEAPLGLTAEERGDFAIGEGFGERSAGDACFAAGEGEAAAEGELVCVEEGVAVANAKFVVVEGANSRAGVGASLDFEWGPIDAELMRAVAVPFEPDAGGGGAVSILGAGEELNARESGGAGIEAVGVNGGEFELGVVGTAFTVR